MSKQASRNFRWSKGGRVSRAYKICKEIESREGTIHLSYEDDTCWMDITRGYDLDAEYEHLTNLKREAEKGKFKE